MTPHLRYFGSATSGDTFPFVKAGISISLNEETLGLALSTRQYARYVAKHATQTSDHKTVLTYHEQH